MGIRLVVPIDNTVLYYQDIVCRTKENPQYVFKDDKAIIQNKDRALEGLSTNITRIASLIGDDLNKNNSIVYVYWPYNFFAAGAAGMAHENLSADNVSINGRKMTLYMNNCKSLRIPPGRYLISGTTATLYPARAEPIELQIESDKTCYVKVGMGMVDAIKLTVVSEEEGAAAVAKYNKTANQKLMNGASQSQRSSPTARQR